VIVGAMPSHRHRLQIRSDDGPYETIHVGLEESIIITSLEMSERYKIRVQSWNNVGSSNWTESNGVRPGKEPCDEQHLRFGHLFLSQKSILTL
jgi:hypothetical protein